jgi:hypothetical protein
MAWCQQTLHEFGITSRPIANQFITPHGQIIPEWYEPFLFRTRRQVAAGLEPQLALSPKLDDSPDSPELGAMKARLEALQAAGYEQV